MLFLPESAGPHDPVTVTPPRAPGSVRRTSSIDTSRPDGFDGEVVVEARARDLRTGPDGQSAVVVGEVTVRARLGPGRDLRAVEVEPAGTAVPGGLPAPGLPAPEAAAPGLAVSGTAVPGTAAADPLGPGLAAPGLAAAGVVAHGLAALIGARVGAGFRALLDQVLPGEGPAGGRGSGGEGPGGGGRGGLLYFLLDDMPGAALVAGYAVQRAGGLEGLLDGFGTAGAAPGRLSSTAGVAIGDGHSGPHAAEEPGLGRPGGNGTAGTAGDVRRSALATMFRDDLCAGWVHEGVMMTAIREQGAIPVPVGPPAPSLDAPGDPLAWHAMADLGPHHMRRRRRIDVVPPDRTGGVHRVDAHFRDSHVDGEGRETVLHEYTVVATVAAGTGRVVEASAVARVLPWTECPGAAASAGRLAGMDLATLRQAVRRDFVGRSTCTHLNDTLRALADVGALLDLLA